MFLLLQILTKKWTLTFNSFLWYIIFKRNKKKKTSWSYSRGPIVYFMEGRFLIKKKWTEVFVFWKNTKNFTNWVLTTFIQMEKVYVQFIHRYILLTYALPLSLSELVPLNVNFREIRSPISIGNNNDDDASILSQ